MSAQGNGRTVSPDWDVAVIGAGHAGCEAALAAARVGARVLLLTMSETAIAAMPCNPSFGGPGKGHLVREIDALGGMMGAAADAAARQRKLLNTSKGPAVQALRVIVDKDDYQRLARRRIAQASSAIEIMLGEVVSLTPVRRSGYRLVLSDGAVARAKTVVVAAGVYLNAATVCGDAWRQGGPGSEGAAVHLTAALRQLGLAFGRFKTGTSPRVEVPTADLRRLRIEWGDAEHLSFSHQPAGSSSRQAVTARELEPVCWRTDTTPATHRIIHDNVHRSPLLSGAIRGLGPRHCPSVEDKVIRFPGRESHPVYLERERGSTSALYVLGLSTSLPADVQDAMVASLPGLAGATISSYGYAIEYDYVIPTQLHPTLEARQLPGLFFAGQICGTSGYEEAAALGLVAGLNAARRASDRDPVVFARSDSYIGVVASDLTARGISEPYRVMTARAEHRLHLRQTNADLRLTGWGYDLGLVGDSQLSALHARQEALASARERLAVRLIRPGDSINRWLLARGTAPLAETVSCAALLTRPEVDYRALREIAPDLADLGHDDRHEVSANAKYGGYIAQQERLLTRQRRRSSFPIDPDFAYQNVPGLSGPGRASLLAVRPLTLEQAAAMPDVTAADLAILEAALQARREAPAGKGGR